MSWLRDLLTGGGSSARATSSTSTTAADPTLTAPTWNPSDPAAQRVAAYARKVARELTAAGVAPTVEGGNFWIASFDVHEAIWYPAAPGSWAAKNNRMRDGWSQGGCLVLFTSGEVASGEWFGEVEPTRGAIEVDAVAPLSTPAHRWSSGNLARWRNGTGGLHPSAREHFKGFWPGPRKPLPDWAGTSAQLKSLLTTQQPQVPRYYS